MSQRRQDWYTPVSSFKTINFTRLWDDGSLVLAVENAECGDDRVFKFTWPTFYSYRSTMEGDGLPWSLAAKEPWLSGCTQQLSESDWIRGLRERSDYFQTVHPNAIHYVICTSTYVIEVLSNERPEIEVLNCETELRS